MPPPSSPPLSALYAAFSLHTSCGGFINFRGSPSLSPLPCFEHSTGKPPRGRDRFSFFFFFWRLPSFHEAKLSSLPLQVLPLTPRLNPIYFQVGQEFRFRSRNPPLSPQSEPSSCCRCHRDAPPFQRGSLFLMPIFLCVPPPDYRSRVRPAALRICNAIRF